MRPRLLPPLLAGPALGFGQPTGPVGIHCPAGPGKVTEGPGAARTPVL